jgi:GDP-L-fucose synthase
MSKLLGLMEAQYLFEEEGILTICPILANIYGPNDYFDDDRSHVVAAMIRKFELAKQQNSETVSCWGSGKAKREFIFVNDAAKLLVALMNDYTSPTPINVGTGVSISIFELANLIKKLCGFNGKIEWDLSKPEGMPEKCMDITRLRSMGLAPSTSLEEGLTSTISYFRKRIRDGIER